MTTEEKGSGQGGALDSLWSALDSGESRLQGEPQAAGQTLAIERFPKPPAAPDSPARAAPGL